MTRGEALSMRQRLTAPRAAGVAGILFAVLFGVSIVLIRIAVDRHPGGTTAWTGPEAAQIRFALGLMPYAGIAFLWFIGVVRDRIGDLEDRFFATVFLGSGLIFVAMVFASAAVAGGILVAGEQLDVASAAEVTTFARAEMLQITNVYALRMAGVFMISLGTVWLRTAVMPRWTSIMSYVLALALLLMIDLSLWVQLIFPVWTLVVSVIFLVRVSQAGDDPSAS